MLKGKNILITGIDGFIGNRLKKYFNKKNIVIGISRKKKKIKSNSNISSGVSISSLKKLKKIPDIIFHCAGGSSVSQSILNPKKDLNNNFITTKHIFNFYKNKEQKPLIFLFSSAAVYGNTKKKLKPISPYGKHKLMAEKLSINYSKKYNFKIIIMRLFSVYGEGLKKQLFWDICKKLKKNKHDYYGSGKEKRCWLHIKDLIEAINVLLKQEKRITIVDIGSFNQINNKKIVSLFYKYFKKNLKAKFNLYKRKGDPNNQTSNNLIMKSLGWKPKVNINSGIKNYVKWFKKLKQTSK